MPKRLAMVLTFLFTLGVGQMWGETWEKATSIAAGDVVLLVCESKKMELSSISTTSTKYGIGTAYTTTPDGLYELTVEAGSSSGTFSFKKESTYLYWSSENSLATNITKSANTSWTVTFSNGNATIKNAKDATRIIGWNASSPRFACYTSSQTAVQLYKKVTAAPSYIITAQSNNTSYGTVSLSGTTITASPKTGYRVSTTTPYTISPSGSATVTPSGNTFTVTPTANTTITINFEAIPKYKVTFDAGSGSCSTSSLTETSAGAGVTLPTATICDGWEFAGWKETSAVNTETTTAPTLLTAGSTYKPTENCTLYAVYSRTEEGNGGGSSTITFTFSYIATANSWSNGTAYTTVTIDPVTITANGGGNNGKYYTSDKTWRMYNGGSLSIESNSTNITSVTSNPTTSFTISNGTATCSFSETVKFKSITVTTSGGSSSTTYYHSTPECAPTIDCDLLTFATNVAENHSATYTQNTAATALTVSAEYDNNATGVTYQWYSNTTKFNTGGTAINGATNASYTPSTSATGTKYYYCVATYNECTITSNVATIVVNAAYTVTFDSDGGSTVAKQTIEEGETATKPTNPEKNGYEFAGWYNGNTEFDFATPITGNITLKAKWNIITYNITYEGVEPTEHSNPKTYTVETETITFTAPSNRDGYVFKGWNPASITKGSTGDKTVTAQWTTVHKITWIVGEEAYNNGTPTISVESGQKITAIPTAPSDQTLKDCGATKFMGWSESNLGSEAGQSAPADLFTTLEDAKKITIDANKTFYAVFATEESTNTTETSTTTISGKTSGTIANVLSWSSAQNGGTAVTAWNEDHFRLYPNKSNGNGSSITITPVSGVTISTVVLTATSTTYAKPVKYNIDGGSDISGTWNSTTMTISNINATSSFKFRNAHTGANNDQVRVTVSVTYSKGSSSTSYSNYITNCCTTPAPTNGSYTTPSGTSVALTWEGESTRYHITGGSLGNDVYTTEESYTITGLTECDEYTFYVSAYPADGCESEAIAITAQPFSGVKVVTFNYNGNGQENTTFATDCDNNSTTLPTPTWDGYNFTGWYDAITGGNKIGEGGASYTPTTTIILCAQWEKVKTATSLTWSADSYTATIASESNVFPTLIVNPDAIKESITYSSSDETVATIDAAGNIRLLAEGTTIITASYTGDEDYAAAEDSYYLTVEKSTNCRWGEVTIDDIEYGDEVVIAVGGTDANGEAILYMLQDPQEAKNPIVKQMSMTDFLDVTNLNNILIWNIRKRDDDKNNFTIYRSGSTTDRLAFISNYGVRVGGNNVDSIFTITNEGYIKSVTSNEFLKMSGSSDWRHYSTNTNQSFVFYKRICLPSNVSRVTYSVGNGDTAPEEQEVVNNTSITLPQITTNFTCVNFVGWTDAASDAEITSSNIYKDNYTVTENVTLKAVYAAGGGYVLVTDVANLAVGDKIIIVNSEASVAMGEQRESNRGQVSVEIVDNTISNIGESQILTIENGTKSETFAFYTGEGYLYAASSGSNHLKTQTTNNDNGSWTIAINNAGVATIKAQGTYTRNWLRYNDQSDIFSCYSSGQSDVSIYKEDIAGYTTTPACVTYSVTTCTPINGTISMDKTTVDPYGSTTVTFTPDAGHMLQAVTVTSGTATVGSPSYTTSQISGGTVTISDIQSDIEVCATFVKIPYYKVTFVDMNNGNSTQEVSQSAFGADIVAPSTASEGCDGTWTFVGWALSSDLNGASEVPNGLVAPGGTISGSSITSNDLTYYSVYSNSSDGTPPFSIGKSGTYYFKAIKENDEVYYATGDIYSNKYRSNQPKKIPFYVNYNTTTQKYTIKNTLTNKYVTPTYDNGWDNALQEQATAFEWNILSHSLGDFTLYVETNNINSDAKTGEYLFTYVNKGGNTRAIYFNGTYFQSNGLTYSNYALYLEPASEMRYYNASSCTELVTMSFDVPADAELTYEDGYPEGYYKDSEKKNVSTFPTLTYEGWTFVGWTAGTSYNDQIGDANLDDENSSPTLPSETIYKTGGGETYNLVTDVTMYPVFTKYADNEPFDIINGGDYYIYYIADGDVATSEDEYGATNRIYAGGWQSGGTSDSYGSTQSCANATLFTFTKLSNGKWSIYDNTKEKYLCAGSSDNNLALNTTTATNGEWTIEVHNGNQVNAVSKDTYTLSAYSQDAISGTFKNYATSNFSNNSGYYHRVYLGSCTERVYSSNPSNKPKITLNGTAVVTSTKDQTIRSAKSLSLSAVKLTANGTITLTSDNADVYFSTDKAANFSKGTKPVASLTINADANGKLALTTVYVHYKPAAVPTSNLDIQTVTITATTGTDGQPNYATATTTATVRNLPADFVIAAKVNDIWYALPNNCNSTSIVNGLPIDVDDPINPTSATFAPAEAKWGLKPVYTTSGANDRYADYGEYFVFAETNTGTAGLLYSNKDNAQVQTQGTYSGISGYQEIPRYEWIPTTTDLITYQLAGAQDSKQLNINVNGVFGTHSQLVAENELRLLPIDAIYQHAEVQVVEWRADAVVFMYTGDPNHSVTTTLASTSTTKSLSEIKIDHGVYKMPVSNLLNNAGQTMDIKFHDGATEIARTEITIPVIINGETNTSSLTALAKADYETVDVVILNGGKLTTTEGNAAKYRFRNVTVYGGGKLVIGEGKYLSMASIILRAGGFANDGTYEYVYPQFELKGNLSNTAGKFYYDYITDYDHWYHLVLPFAGDLGTIKYPTEFYGSNVTTSNSGSWIIKRYAGDIRATGNYSAWVDIETDNPKPTATTPGVGYIFWGAPKKVTVNGDKQRQQWGIQRISMTKGAGTAKDEEKADKTIYNLSSYENVANNSGQDNDQGWNLIGNPYMVDLTNMSTSGLHACKLVEVIDPATGKWNGQWEWNDETNIRYLTIPSDHFDTYTAKTVTQAVPLVAGRAFFVQLEGEANGVTFSAANRASLMPQHLAAQNTGVAVETGIILSNETMQDEMNFWIKDGKTNDYEYNADYPKTPNSTNFNIYGVHINGSLSWVATGPEYAEESMPIGYQVPAAGTYTLSISETYYSDLLDALFVTDHAMSPEVTVDLMSAPYEFSVNQAETNNERFTVSVRLKSENQGPTTGLENAGVQRDGLTKFIYQDKMFILHNGIIYDATGKKVTTINK